MDVRDEQLDDKPQIERSYTTNREAVLAALRLILRLPRRPLPGSEKKE